MSRFEPYNFRLNHFLVFFVHILYFSRYFDVKVKMEHPVYS